MSANFLIYCLSDEIGTHGLRDMWSEICIQAMMIPMMNDDTEICQKIVIDQARAKTADFTYFYFLVVVYL